MNQVLEHMDWLVVKEPFRPVKDDPGNVVAASFIVPVPGDPSELEISACATVEFPLGELRFIGYNFSGYPHQMDFGWICLNAELSPEVGPRLELELDKLKAWIKKYYIDREQDDHYEYPTVHGQEPYWILFEEDNASFEPKDSYGWFEYRGLRHIDRGDTHADTWIVTKIGQRKSRWSEVFVNSLSYKQDGLYVLISGAPLGVGRQLVETWRELLVYLNDAQRRFIYDQRQKVRENGRIGDGFFLLAGYPIVDGTEQEYHWLPIYLSVVNFPYEPLKIPGGGWSSKDLGKKVVWGVPENASYRRLFGRGQLTEQLTDKKILILGTGAVGSTLFMSLVRGGCRHVDIQDGDHVTAGNVARGHFELKATAFGKVDELVSQALSISPYLNVTALSKRFAPVSPGSPRFQEERRRLNGYQYIFDCTTDKLLSVSLDKMQLTASVHNLSLTNGAGHFAWITGFGNIHLVKSAFFARVEEPEHKTLFVANGCWHPTFIATNVDIQILVNLGLKEFTRMLDEEENSASFYIERTGGKNETVGYQIKNDV